MTLPEQQPSMAEDSAQWQQAGRQAHDAAQTRHSKHTTRGAQHGFAQDDVQTSNRFSVFNSNKMGNY